MRKPSIALIWLILSGGAAAAAAQETVCDFLVRHPVTRSHSADFVFPPGYVDVGNESRHDLDLDGDGVPDEIVSDPRGIAMEDAFTIKLSSLNGQEVSGIEHDPTQPDQAQLAGLDYSGNAGTGEFWLRYGGRHYDIFYSDNSDYSELEYAQYFLPSGKSRYACIFKNEVRTLNWNYEPVQPALRDDAKKVCPPNGKIFDQPPPIQPVARISTKEAVGIPAERLGETHFSSLCDRKKADCKDIWQVDFDNDGTAERLVKLVAYSGSGRGCDAEKFVLLDAQNRPIGGSKQAALEKLRGACESQMNWVRIRGRTVLLRQPPQDLAMARGKDAALLCSAVFRMIPKTAYIDPLLEK